MTTPTTHSDMGPSTLDRRAACPGSLRMERGQPELTNEDAERGTDLHAVISETISKRYRNATTLADLEPADKDALEYCLAQLDGEERAIESPVVTVECRLDLEWLGLGWGTADLVFGQFFGRCAVFDWKFGYQLVEPAPTNLQLAAYALGVARQYDASEVAAYIVQPARRATTMEVFNASAMQRAEQRIRCIVAACNRPDAPLHAGPHCQFCRGAAHCPALQKSANELATVESTDALTVDQLARVLDLADRVETLIGAARARAYAILVSGGNVPGWTLREGRRQRGWTDPLAATTALEAAAKALGKPPGSIWQTKLSSPAMLEQEWGKSADVRRVLEPLISLKSGKLKLERE